jgi:hypothetical protein
MASPGVIETPTVVFLDVLGFGQQVLHDNGALDLLDSFYSSSYSFNELVKHFHEARDRPRKSKDSSHCFTLDWKKKWLRR